MAGKSRAADLTIEILKEIRDGVRETNARIDQTNERLETMRTELSTRIDATNTRMDAVEKVLHELAGQFVFIAKYVRHTARRQGARIDALETRVGKLEERPPGQ
ncbi:MAG: hypothetical protein HY906_05245 [Deltaproteobacteria bacterium]|nr:hypothetical protein [Deltaproteobacteria bacterium]